MMIKKYEGIEETKGINLNLLFAYERSQELGLEVLDIADDLFEEPLKALIEELKEVEVKEFTFSASNSGMIKTLEAFQEAGWKIEGIVQVKANSRGATKPAFKLNRK